MKFAEIFHESNKALKSLNNPTTSSDIFSFEQWKFTTGCQFQVKYFRCKSGDQNH